MKKQSTTNSPATLTHNAQARILQRHILAFIKAQMKATQALKAINEIALGESEGNPLPCALAGTGMVLSYACNGQKEFDFDSDDGFRQTTKAEVEAFEFLLTHTKQALDASGYWASNA